MKDTPESREELQERGARQKREADVQRRVLRELKGAVEIRVTEITPNQSYRVNVLGRRPGSAEFLSVLEKCIVRSHYVTVRRNGLHAEPPLT